MDLFRKKSVDQLVSESTPLKRTLKTFDLTMLGIGAIIGTGIFVLTGKGALTAGPALCVSFLLAAICCGFAGLCYAEFAAMAPVSGSAYSYAYLAFGELIAFVIGWDLILEYALQAATVSAGWSGYFNKLLEGFGLHLPVELTAAYGTTPGVTTYFNLPGFVIVLIITWVLSIGINQTKKTNDIMVMIKLAIIVLFIVCTVWYINPANWKPFSPYGIYTFQPGSTQPYGIVPAASIVFFSFIGFDAVSSSAEETINPNKTLPRGILISLAVSTVLYIIMTLIMTGVVPYKEFAKFIDAPVAGVILETGLNWLAFIVNLGALIGMTTVMLVQLYGQSRICYAMSRDGLFPKFFGEVHPKYRTPFKRHLLHALHSSGQLGIPLFIILIGLLAQRQNYRLSLFLCHHGGGKGKNIVVVSACKAPVPGNHHQTAITLLRLREKPLRQFPSATLIKIRKYGLHFLEIGSAHLHAFG